MSLRILFADDSVTAQNMGKRILTEAGYDVVVVSNGAAAVKKIAEQKPDIIILDVYMPGYTGLEVCEKVRGSIETLKTPILLTVGKLEPYTPEETNRVRADGVIVKPFEASDLLAIMKKFEERLGPVAATPPLLQRSIAGDRLDATDSTGQPTYATSIKTGRTTVEAPDHMAAASASSDLPASFSREIPVYKNGEPSAAPGVLPTAAAPTGDVLIPREPYLQESDTETRRNRVVDSREPALVPPIVVASTPVTEATAENTRTATHEARARLLQATAGELMPRRRLVARTDGTQGFEAVETKISESEFEARVAAGIEAHNQSTAARESEETAAENSRPEAPAAPRRTLWPLEKSVGVTNAEPLPSRSGQLSSAGAEISSDHNTVAEAVDRVMERLKPELVEEIVKELKAKK